jgi:dipeptidyl aminopeptidase/acylaminoacyl peptidase
MTTVAPFGSWASPLSLSALTEQAVRLSNPSADGTVRYWVEGRPAEKGRAVLMRQEAGHPPAEALSSGFSVRTLMHEYGGLCYAVVDGVIVFSNFDDQRLYRFDGSREPWAITPEPPDEKSIRYACPNIWAGGDVVVCVRERHQAGVVTNDLVAIDASGRGETSVLASGHDFYSAPVLSPDGTRLAWVQWDHPQMSWDGTELCEARFDGQTASSRRVVAGGIDVSVSVPLYSPEGILHFASDQSGWWNLYAEDGGSVVALYPASAEFAQPDWVFGNATYAFLSDGRMAAVSHHGGADHLGLLRDGIFSEIATEFDAIESLHPCGDGLMALAGSTTRPAAVVEISLEDGTTTTLARSRPVGLDQDQISVPRSIEFPTEGGLTAHAYFYPPQNAEFVGPETELPPLLVVTHGGPTSSASPVLNFERQFWTSRGFAMVDVDYGGSTGYGREYRNRLRGQWGVVDVDDCINAARYLADQGLVDGERMAIRGWSAGGFTTLAALTFRDVFAAGASHYGVADMGSLAEDTHKFEARYLDSMVGPWPAARDLYEARSPIFHVDQLATPIILLQGLDDPIVPPAQAEMMVAALEARGIPHAYVAFPGEQHGFRQAKNIQRAAEAELYFYSRIFGFTPADDLEPVEIRNLAG